MTDEELIRRLRASRAVWEDGKCHPTDDETAAADRIEALRVDLKSAELRLGVLRTTCSGMADQLMNAHTEIAQALGKAGGEG